MSLHTILHPSLYHGFNQKAPFFEGWYYKLVSADERHKIAIIPGVILGKDRHAFVQVLEGVQGTATYHTFPLAQFQASRREFSIQIDQNYFDGNHIALQIDSSAGKLSGEVEFGTLNPWQVTWTSPGIMGWFAWLPGMECNHGVLSFDHSLQGKITLNDKVMDFNEGRGYIEKDWGRSFPSAWVWLQSNHFEGVPACITASVATIPFAGSAFRGFIVGLWLEGKLYRFATYSGARIESLQIYDDQVEWILRDRRYRLLVNAVRGTGGVLRGPTPQDMSKRVPETLNARIHVRLETGQGNLIFEGVGKHGGLEVVGDLKRLINNPKDSSVSHKTMED